MWRPVPRADDQAMRPLLLRSLLAAGALAVGIALLLPPSSGSQPSALHESAGTAPDSEPEMGDQTTAPLDRSAGAPTDPDPGVGGQTPAPPGQLHPGLVAALGAAQQAATADGFLLSVTSGYRTPERQRELLDEEVVERGSLEEASRWVFPPDRSMHVRGLAVDVGNGPAADWLDTNGSAWGICRTLDWEWWHFEWRERWESAGSCPPPAHDVAGAPTA